MIKGFSEWINESTDDQFGSLIMDKDRWVRDTRTSFENALDDEDIEESMEDYYWNKYRDASESAWQKITSWLGDDTPIYLELYTPPEWITSRTKDQRWVGIQNLMKKIEKIHDNREFSGEKVTDMLTTEPSWIPILTELSGERIVILAENSELDQLFGGAYALVPRRVAREYLAPHFN